MISKQEQRANGGIFICVFSADVFISKRITTKRIYSLTVKTAVSCFMFIDKVTGVLLLMQL